MSRKISVNNSVGVREKNKLAAISAEITEYEKEAKKLLAKTAKAYYNAGNIILGILKRWDYKEKRMSNKAIYEATGFPEHRITIALKIFKHFENNPDALNGLALRDALRLIAPPPPAGEDGYNRIDLGGNAGQMQLEFGELFSVPSTVNQALQNYRTVSERYTDIIVVRRTNDGGMISKCFAHFGEDIPQNSDLKHAYKIMSQKTQAAIEDYLAAVEQSELSSGEAQG